MGSGREARRLGSPCVCASWPSLSRESPQLSPDSADSGSLHPSSSPDPSVALPRLWGLSGSVPSPPSWGGPGGLEEVGKRTRD